MAIQAVPRPATFIGPAADKAAFVSAAAIGDFFFEDDTGILYRKSVAGAWVAVVEGAISAPLPAGTNNIGDVDVLTLPGYSFLNVVAGQATTVVKSGAGVLHSLTFWGPPTALATFNAYDNTAASGTLIAGPILAAGVVVATTFLLDAAFATGLTIITATANWAGYTVTYR